MPKVFASRDRRSRSASSPITIVLADALRLVRGGVRCLVEAEHRFKVVGEAGDGVDAIRLVARLKPRVLITGVAMPRVNGLEITREVRQQSPDTAVIVLSRSSEERDVLQALRNGASGYVVKCASPAELARAIRTVVAGHRYLSEPLSERPIETWLQRARSTAADADERLTRRERQVLQLVAEGYSNARMAARLSISRRTVESHRASASRKLGLRNQLELVRYILSREILAPCG